MRDDSSGPSPSFLCPHRHSCAPTVIPAPPPSFLRRQEPALSHTSALPPSFLRPSLSSFLRRQEPVPRPSFLRRQEPALSHTSALPPSFLHPSLSSFLRRQEPRRSPAFARAPQHPDGSPSRLCAAGHSEPRHATPTTRIPACAGMTEGRRRRCSGFLFFGVIRGDPGGLPIWSGHSAVFGFVRICSGLFRVVRGVLEGLTAKVDAGVDGMVAEFAIALCFAGVWGWGGG